jgi:hypothetical protein
MKVNSTRVLAISASRLWDGVTSNGHLSLSHPYVQHHRHEERMCLGAKDIIIYVNGLTFERTFIAWDEGVGYDLRIGRPQGKSRSLVEWRIQSLGPNESSLSITVYPDFLKAWPLWLRWVVFRIKANQPLKNYLEAVTCGIKHWLETDTPVRRSDHPNHPWFGDTQTL